MSGLPSLPPRPSKGVSAQKGGGDALQAMAQRASELANSSAIQKLMQDPQMLQQAIKSDPALGQLLSNSPDLQAMLQPEKLKQVLAVAQQPEKLLSGEAGGSLASGDLSEKRKTLIQLQQYTQQLQMATAGRLAGASTAGGPQERLAQAFQRMQERLAQVQRMQLQSGAGPMTMMGGFTTPGSAAAARPLDDNLRPPTQSAAPYNPDHHMGANGPSEGYEGTFSYSHQVRDVDFSQLPPDVQQQMLAASGMHPHPHQHPPHAHPHPYDAQPGAPGQQHHHPYYGYPYGYQHPLSAGPGAGAGAGAGPSGMPYGGITPAGGDDAGIQLPVSQNAADQQQQQQGLYGGGGGGSGHGYYQHQHQHPHPRDGGQQSYYSYPYYYPNGHHHHGHHGHGHGYDHHHMHDHDPGQQGPGPLQRLQQLGAQGMAAAAQSVYYVPPEEGDRAASSSSQGLAGLGLGLGLGDVEGGSGHGVGGAGPTYMMPDQAPLDPKRYYETVQPSEWRPGGEGDGENCSELYRRAYCAYGDVGLPPAWFAAAALLCTLPGLPIWVLMIVIATLGLILVIVMGSLLRGLPTQQPLMGRLVLSFIACLEIIYPSYFLYYMLPYWHGATSGSGLMLIACLAVLPVLHAWAAVADPGFVKKPEEAAPPLAALGEGPVSSERQPLLIPGTAGHDHDHDHDHMNGGALRASGSGTGSGSGLPVSTSASASASAVNNNGNISARDVALPTASAASLNTCATCHTERPLRSKHCPLCGRCVRRLDHHCPAIGTCVGEGNQRVFAAWLFVIVMAQALFIVCGCTFLVQQVRAFTSSSAGAGAAAIGSRTKTSVQSPGSGSDLGSEAGGGGAGGGSGLGALAAALAWGAETGHYRGLVMLMALQALCLIPGAYLAARQAYLIAANLTTNELANKGRYTYLQHELHGYCNRFDRGVVANCVQFWTEPAQDWWKKFDEGDRDMVSRGSTVLARFSVASLYALGADFRRRHAELRRAVEEVRLQKAMKALEARSQAESAAKAKGSADGMHMHTHMHTHAGAPGDRDGLAVVHASITSLGGAAAGGGGGAVGIAGGSSSGMGVGGVSGSGREASARGGGASSGVVRGGSVSAHGLQGRGAAKAATD